MTQTEEIIELRSELERVKLLLQKCNSDIVRADRELKSERNKAIDEVIERFKTWSIDDPPFAYPTFLKELESLKVDLLMETKQEKYEPYMGYCDVSGCFNEASAQGVYWPESGYWHTCHKHCQDAREGKEQPKMKVSAIKREKSRDKITGELPPFNQKDCLR